MTTAASEHTIIKPAPQNPRRTVPEVDVRICLGTGGVAAGSREVLQAFEEGLANTGVMAVIRPREDDCAGRCAAVTGTGCQGLCAMDPLVEIHQSRNGSMHQVTYGSVTPAMVPQIIEKHILGGEIIEKWLVRTEDGPTKYDDFFANQEKLTLRHVGVIDPEDIDDYLEAGGYQALYKVLTSMTAEQVIEEIKASGLRGRGGAGFSTGLKWQFAHDAKSPDGMKYFICNGDEGDPGAFMDCSALEGEPHAVFEGMAIGAYAIGASEGYMYVRAEYPLALRRIKIGLKVAEERGLIGDNIMGSDFSFHIHLKEGAGAFVCGEETALMQSIEGSRGMPRLRPPFPAQSGLWKRPSNINNVETLAVVPWIIENGAEAFAARGYEKSKGTKVFALAGKVNRTGLAEVPMGMTLRDVIFDNRRRHQERQNVQGRADGRSVGRLPAGVAARPARRLRDHQPDRRHRGVGRHDRHRRRQLHRRYRPLLPELHPAGELRQVSAVPHWHQADARPAHQDLRRQGCAGRHRVSREMAEQVKVGSLCALGGTAPNPVFTALKYFRDEFEEHVFDKKCRAGICTALVTYSIDAEDCTGCRACVRVCPTGAITGERKEAPCS